MNTVVQVPYLQVRDVSVYFTELHGGRIRLLGMVKCDFDILGILGDLRGEIDHG